jgi:hypothetical protein
VLGSVDVGNQDAAKRVMDVLKGLAEGDWFTSRVSACALHAKVYVESTLLVLLLRVLRQLSCPCCG